ncbi:MAG: hypothetical protein ACI9CF_000171 [Candidatus Omnitrophota bacterium]|jgi:hypothetical protein
MAKQLIALISIFIFSASTYAAEVNDITTQDIQSNLTQAATWILNPLPKKISGPLGQIDYGLSFEESLKPQFYLQSVYALQQDELRNQTLFLQSRVSYNGTDDDVYNIGTGYRRYIESLNALIGFNVFGDYQRDPGHARIGFGSEVLGSNYDIRMNSYIRLSPRRRIEETELSVLYEKAVNGFDFEFGMPIPHVPWIKIFGGGEIYDYKIAEDNLYGWTSRIEIQPLKNTIINLYIKDNNKIEDIEWGVDITFELHLDQDAFKPLNLSERAFSNNDPRDKSLIRVERNNRIHTERFGVAKSSGISFEVGRV